MRANHAYIISLKYSPIHMSHCRSVARSLDISGLSIRYLLSASYRWMSTSGSEAIDYYLKSDSMMGLLISSAISMAIGSWRLFDLFRAKPPALLYFNNFHPLNASAIAIAKRVNPECVTASLIHEPYRLNKNALGGIRGFYAILIEAATVKQLQGTDVAIVASRNAEKLFRLRYPWFRDDLQYVPLLFQDSICSEDVPRHYLSFVGNAVKDKGIDVFFSLLEQFAASSRPLDFQIVTKSDIQAYLGKLSTAACSRLKVINKPHLTDEEIARAIRESIAVLALHRDTTQSGVVPMAFMNATPVIATNIVGLTEFVSHGETGWIIPLDASEADMLAAVGQVSARLQVMSLACRAKYIQVFDSSNAHRYYAPIWAKHLSHFNTPMS